MPEYLFKVYKTMRTPTKTQAILINRHGNHLIRSAEQNIQDYRDQLANVKLNTRSLLTFRKQQDSLNGIIYEQKLIKNHYRFFFDNSQIFKVIYQDFTEFLYFILDLHDKENSDAELASVLYWFSNDGNGIKESRKKDIKEMLIHSGLYGNPQNGSPFTNFSFFIPGPEEGQYYEIMYQIETYVHDSGVIQRIR